LSRANSLRVLASTISLILASAFVEAQPTKTLHSADALVVNARVYTVNSVQPWAEAVAIRGGKVAAVGTAKELEKFRGLSTKVIDAGGRLVLPGFTDAHIHIIEGSLSLVRVHLEDTKTVADVQKLVKQFADEHPHSPWILGRGWSYPIFGATALPDKKFLDEIVPDRPVYLTAFDGHSWWANSKALQLAGITKTTPDPVNGVIVHDPVTGEPTGALKEDGADDLMEHVLPKPTREERLAALRAGLHEANKVGLARGICAGNIGEDVTYSDFENADVYDELRKNGELSVRIYYAYGMDPKEGLTPRVLKRLEQARQLHHDEWISAGAVKFYMDGVIESHTAAMLTPYSDDPSQLGKLFWDPAKYKQTVQRLDKLGFQLFTHAIGEKAVRTALDAYQNAAQVNHTHNRPRIEHIETISEQDIPRFGKLGVIASFQPLHAYPDDDTLKIWARNAGPERAQRAWVWHSIESTGGHLAFGSDWPVVTLNPWYGVQNALTRQTREGDPPGGFVPHERISLEDAIKGYTLGAAYAGRREKSEGSIEPGKVADLIVLSQDLFKIEPNQIANTEVLLTMVGGKVVYQSPSWHSKDKETK
jgi:predicted amidohydrolase YtcJ